MSSEVLKINEVLDKLFQNVAIFLNKFNKSKALQTFVSSFIESAFYATLISNFFKNLTKDNAGELGLTEGDLKEIHHKTLPTQRDARAVLQAKSNKIDLNYYLGFRHTTIKEFPKAEKIFKELEKPVPLDSVQKHLVAKRAEIEKIGKRSQALEDVLITQFTENFIQKKNRFPNSNEYARILKKVMSKRSIRKFGAELKQSFDNRSAKILDENKSLITGFESRLYERWKTPFDQFQCMIRIAGDLGSDKKGRLVKSTNDTKKFTRSALIQLHARAVHISNEILTLLKAGYPDAANARWRSIHELAVIAFFLSKNSEDISERFLNHRIVKSYREAEKYQEMCRKMHEIPIPEEKFQAIKRQHDALLKRYGNDFDFTGSGYEWVPKDLVLPPGSKKRVSFPVVEKKVGLDQWYPFYSWSSNAIHGGARGFERLGTMLHSDILLIGPSNFGLADPLQNTAISLSQVSTCLLMMEPLLFDLMAIQAVELFSKEIGISAVGVQKTIEKEEREIRRKAIPK